MAVMLALCGSNCAPLPSCAGQQALRVGPAGCDFSSISDALSAASPGSTINVLPGRYMERLMLRSTVHILAQGGPVEVVWETKQPYESTVLCNADGEVHIEGITIRHYSKSVANNYAVFCQGGTLSLRDCDVSSASGTGVAAEGASVTLQRCRVHNCVSHGVAVFGAIGGGPGTARLSACTIDGNGLNGVLASDGAVVRVEDCAVRDNQRYGLDVQDCDLQVRGSHVLHNARGSVVVRGLDVVGGDAQQLSAANDLDKAVETS